jgi:hypothetical protein
MEDSFRCLPPFLLSTDLAGIHNTNWDIDKLDSLDWLNSNIDPEFVTVDASRCVVTVITNN